MQLRKHPLVEEVHEEVDRFGNEDLGVRAMSSSTEIPIYLDHLLEDPL